jgi:hypothetical protein
MTKSWVPSRGNNYPENGLVKPPRRVLRKGAALLSGVEEQAARSLSAYARYACLLSLHMVNMS